MPKTPTTTARETYEARYLGCVQLLEKMADQLADHRASFEADGAKSYGYAGDLGQLFDELTALSRQQAGDDPDEPCDNYQPADELSTVCSCGRPVFEHRS